MLLYQKNRGGCKPDMISPSSKNRPSGRFYCLQLGSAINFQSNLVNFVSSRRNKLLCKLSITMRPT